MTLTIPTREQISAIANGDPRLIKAFEAVFAAVSASIPVAVSGNAAAISTNAAAISTNAAAISTNAAGISTNAAGISTNAAAISTNAAAISTNAAGISTNAAGISTNAAAISTNAAGITALQDARGIAGFSLSGTTTITATGTPAKATGTVTAAPALANFTATGNGLTFSTARTSNFLVNFSGELAAAIGDAIAVHIYVNGASAVSVATPAALVVLVSAIQLNQNDIVELWFENKTSVSDISVVNAQLVISEIG